MKKAIFEDKKISIILWIALAVLIVCLGATYLHVYDTRNVYKNKTVEGLESGIDLAVSEVNNRLLNMKTSVNYLVNDYTRVEERLQVQTDDKMNIQRVQQIISLRSDSYYNFDFYYVQGDSVMVSSQKIEYISGLYNKLEAVEDYRFNDSFVFTRGDKYMADRFGNDSVIGIKRYTNANGQHVYFIVSCDFHEFFKEEIFMQINDIGYFAIYDNECNVIAITENYENVIRHGENIFKELFNISDLSNGSNKKVTDLLRTVNGYDEGQITLKSQNGFDAIVYAGTYSEAKKLSYMVYFNPGILENDIKGGAIRSFFVCMFMILIMIALIMYIWFTMNSSNNKMIRLAYVDEITEGYNYNYFKTFSPRIIFSSKETPYFVARFDVLNFRYINESYGHDRADMVLKYIVSTFDEIFEPGKELCVRINSDQFVAIVKNNLEFEDKFEMFIREVSNAAKEAGVKYPVRLRMGIYHIRKEDTEIELMIDRANVARKSVDITQNLLLEVYSDKIITNIRKVDAIESDMEKSLAKGEFRVFIQPKWDIINNRIIGGEALVRWIKEDGSVVYPSDFIPVFESNGFIENLDFYMLEQLCIRMKEMRKDNDKYEFYPISVNQSRILISNPDYVRNIEKTLKRFDADVRFIQLEITENVFFNERDKMLAVVNALKDLGLDLAMDDFGSGYSSLNILKDIPFDVLKIDKAFFDESILSDASKVILKKILEMADALGIDVICEGVETNEQVEMLKGFGCQSVQGYFYGKPMPMDEFIDKYCRKQ